VIQRDAVLNRLDVRRALAQYAAAEADLQLEIAKQYPDIQIGPGYTYEEGHSYFTLGLSATLPVFNRNQGPIAEAEARRREAGRRLSGEADAGDCRERNQPRALYSALKELAEADHSLRTLAGCATAEMQRAVQLGEEDRLALNGVQIEHAVLVEPAWMPWPARRARWASWKMRFSGRSTPATYFSPLPSRCR
jgi:outer membrane protein, heavy metal efflux system